MGGSSCFLCLGARKEVPPPPRADPHSSSSVAATAARTLAFDELAAATRNFRDDFRIVRTSFAYRSPGQALLDWNTRMNIAAGVAKGLEYLHDKGVVYHIFMSSSDVLLGEGNHPKLSQYGLADLGRLVADDDEKLCIDFTRTAAIAPETRFKGKATMESNVYNFGGVLLELITGRRPVDPTRAIAEDCNLVIWATQLMDRGQFRRMADPALQARYPSMDLQEALEVASMCIHEEPAMRSPIGAVVAALSRLAAYDNHPPESSHHAALR
ncbi:receptor-like cytoplasmic kinase 185 [Aegilops tauschii subsp. strangulata]|uniref:receptor-like cytoplasmic kinase 185 n=1 Tax=Aegilops tauschii subsp. strangulata TaxID=200361 RepID=UPI00098A4306|nr:receptor-like cytoplasmic kinase 185 [Aegilops tauschii subsp. strangulata]